jgi:hypothetical protein
MEESRVAVLEADPHLNAVGGGEYSAPPEKRMTNQISRDEPPLTVRLYPLFLLRSTLLLDPLGEHLAGHLSQEKGKVSRSVAAGAIIGLLGRTDKEEIFGSRDRHIEKAALLFQHLVVPKGMARRQTAVHSRDDEYRSPLQTLGRVDGGEHQMVLGQLRAALGKV